VIFYGDCIGTHFAYSLTQISNPGAENEFLALIHENVDDLFAGGNRSFHRLYPANFSTCEP
jgi:hypothetical protein